MKKGLAILASIMGFATTVFGQGQVTLANNAASLIYLWDHGAIIPAPAGSLTFQLYVGPQGAAALTPVGRLRWVLIPWLQGESQAQLLISHRCRRRRRQLFKFGRGQEITQVMSRLSVAIYYDSWTVGLI